VYYNAFWTDCQLNLCRVYFDVVINNAMEPLFKTNKYSTWYFDIVQNARLDVRAKGDGKYYELHHIVPRSFGGSNKKENLILLTAREHFLCHLLLPKMMIDPIKAGKMVYAFFRMKNKHKNSKIFDRFRTSYGLLTTGENNPFYGRTHTAETKEKISRLGKYHSIESRQKMSECKKGKNTGAENHMYGKVHPQEWRDAHSARLSGENHFNFGKDAFTKGRVWVNNSIESKMASPDDVPLLIANGWVKGRLPKQIKVAR